MDTHTGLPVVGMVGGGPLARLSYQAATALGLVPRVLAASPDDPVATIAGQTVLGDGADLATLLDFAEGCDVVTVDPLRVPAEVVSALAERNVTVYPGPRALRYAQDRPVLWDQLMSLGLAVPGAEEPGAVLSALVARSPWGQAAAYPVARTVQRDGAGAEVLAPAPELAQTRATQAQQLAIHLATELDVVGLLAVDLLESTDGRLLVRGLGLGPQEAGLWTIEGARTSQFEQHVRAVLDYPLGETALTAPAVCTASVLGGRFDGMGIDERLHHLFADDPGARVQLYGEPPRPGNMLGHVTVLDESLDRARQRARHAARWLAEGPDSPYGHSDRIHEEAHG